MEKLVRVGKMPGRINEVAVEEGMTIEQVLEYAELSPQGFDIKVNGNVASLTDTVKADTELVLLVQQIKGN